MGPGLDQAQRSIHTLGHVRVEGSQYPPRTHPQNIPSHIQGRICTPLQGAHTHAPLDLTWEPSDGTHVCLMWQKAARGTVLADGPVPQLWGRNGVIRINKAQRAHTAARGTRNWGPTFLAVFKIRETQVPIKTL